MKAKSPFKFLDPYTEDDSDFFFGRGQEVNLLHEFIRKNRIVLVYGPSGSGKTSIVRCGLANKMEPMNWCPVIIRRAENINTSILSSLVNKFPEHKRKDIAVLGENKEYIKLIQTLGAYYLSPVYLIFDQFEEYLIMGDKKAENKNLSPAKKSEREEFITFLQDLKSAEFSGLCNIIIIMQEEFFGMLDRLERKIPGLSDRRLRVDPIQENDIKEVILKTLDYKEFNITLQENKPKNVDKIYKAIKVGSKEDNTLLPHLQVYLELLWREDYINTYGEEGFTGEGFAPLTLTGDQIDKFGNLGNVLEKFLEDRKALILKELKQKFHKLEKDFVDRVLSEFVSDFGTKIPILYKLTNETFSFPKIKKHFFENFNTPQLNETLKKLAENKIIRIGSNTMELAHDTLAKLIDDQRGKNERELITIRTLVQNYYRLKKKLPYESIKEWKGRISEIKLSALEAIFLKNNILEGEKENEAMLFADYKKKRRQKMLLYLVIFGVFCICTLLYAGRRLIRSADSYYALGFAKTNIDTIHDQNKKLNLLMYMYYFRDDYAGDTKAALKKMIVDLSNEEPIQKQFADFTYALKNGGPLKEGDISIGNGNYFIVKNDSANTQNYSKYSLLRIDTLANKIDTVRTFDSLTYAYFIPGSDSLLLAKSSRIDSVSLQYPNNPNLYCLYKYKDSSNQPLAFKNIGQKRLLIDMNTLISKNRSWDDNLFVRKSRISQSLIVPFEVVAKDSLNRYVFKRYIEVIANNNAVSKPFPCDYTYSLSRDKKYLLFGQNRRKGRMRIYTVNLTNDKLVEEAIADSNSTAFDFTEDGHIWTIKDSILKVINFQTGKEEKRILLGFKLKYAYIASVDLIAVVIDYAGQFHLVNLKNEVAMDISGGYLGKNKTSTSFYFNAIDSTNSNRTLITAYSFSNGVLSMKTDTIKGVVLRSINNAASGDIMVLVKERIDDNSREGKLYVIDDLLNIRGNLAVSTNSLFGSNRVGDVIYYVRDNNLAVYLDVKKLKNINENNFYLFEDWFKRSPIAMKKNDFYFLSDSLVGLKFPSQWWHVPPRTSFPW